MSISVRLVRYGWVGALRTLWFVGWSATLACGPTADEGEDTDLSRYAGEWVYVEPTSFGADAPKGAVSLTCGDTLQSERLTGVVLLEETSAGELIFTASPTCRIQLDVRGDIATAKPGSGCALTIRKTTASGKFDGFALAVHGDQLWLEATGAATLSVGTGRFSCGKVEISSALARHPNSTDP